MSLVAILLIGMWIDSCISKSNEAKNKQEANKRPRILNGLSTLEDVVYKTNNYRPRS